MSGGPSVDVGTSKVDDGEVVNSGVVSNESEGPSDQSSVTTSLPENNDKQDSKENDDDDDEKDENKNTSSFIRVSEEANTQKPETQQEEEQEEEQPRQVAEPPAGGAEEERRLIKENDWEKKEIRARDVWFLIPARWIRSWKDYVDWKDTGGEKGPRPQEIDNKVMIEPGTQNCLRHNFYEGDDFETISSECWDLFYKWYGGGPLMPRRVITQTSYSGDSFVIELRQLNVKLVRSSMKDDPTKEIRVSFSKNASVGEMRDLGCKFFKLDSNEIRLWDWHGKNKIKLLTSMRENLDDAQIVNNQYVLYEEKDANGKFPELESRYSNSYNNHYNVPSKPGVTGLINLGNTCFMNSSLQCLSNTVPLSNYFLTRTYKRDLNENNPLGTKGELAVEYHELLKELWSGSSSATAPRDVKRVIGKFAPQFSGYNQHDSQELLGFLMDRLHEDINRVRVKPYVETKESAGRPDSIVAREQWDNYKLRNDSAIVDLFQGQLKSTLVCPDCGKISITFDPFMYLSLPLPIKDTRDLEITLVWQDPKRKPTKYKVVVPKEGDVKDIKEELSKLSGVDRKDMIFTELYNSRFFKDYRDDEKISKILERDVLYMYQVPMPKREAKEKEAKKGKGKVVMGGLLEEEKGEKSAEEKEENGQEGKKGKEKKEESDEDEDDDDDDDDDGDEYIYIPVLLRKEQICTYRTYNNQQSSYPKKSLFGIPFIICVKKNITYKELYHQMLVRLQRFLPEDILTPLQRPEPVAEEPEAQEQQQDADNGDRAENGETTQQTEDRDRHSSSTAEEHSLQTTTAAGDHTVATSSSHSENEGPDSGNSTTAKATQDDGEAETSTTSSDEHRVHTNEAITTVAKDGESQEGEVEGSGTKAASSDEENEEDDDDDDDDEEDNNKVAEVKKQMPVPDSRLKPMNGRPVLFIIRAVDNFGMTDYQGFRNNDEGLNLSNRQTLALCWDADNQKQSMEMYKDEEEGEIETHSSAAVKANDMDDKISVEQCVELFTQTEKLGEDNLWYCNQCKDFKQATKKFDLWKLPKILVVHLKRFSYQNRYSREKLETFVEFPVEELNLKPYVLSDDEDQIGKYKLYAVSNHYGSLGGGHYTAFAYNHREDQWYKFDDSSTSKFASNSVQTNAAYVLFYRRIDGDDKTWKALSAEEAEVIAKEQEEKEAKGKANGGPKKEEEKDEKDNNEEEEDGLVLEVDSGDEKTVTKDVGNSVPVSQGED